MNLKDLTYLIAIADHNHFGKAAAACNVSQPALSMQIKKLETDLNVILIERTNKSVNLTDTGKLIAAQARRIINQVQEIRETAAGAKNIFSGDMRIGIFPTLASYLLPLIIPQLTKRFHKLSFHLIETHSSTLIENLQQGKIHAAFLTTPVIATNLHHKNLFEEELLLAAHSNHPISQKKSVKHTDLSGEKMILLEEGHCLRDQALALCKELQMQETVSATSLETLRHMITAGAGMALMPKLAAHTSSSTISYLPFQQPKPARKIGLYWRAGSAKEIVMQEIAAHIKKTLAAQEKVTVME
jgi:LysR family hydrogen peroxide-inducible transcriptional activator